MLLLPVVIRLSSRYYEEKAKTQFYLCRFFFLSFSCFAHLLDLCYFIHPIAESVAISLAHRNSGIITYEAMEFNNRIK